MKRMVTIIILLMVSVCSLSCVSKPPFFDPDLAAAVNRGQVLVILKPAIAGKPIKDAVWDNMQGVYCRSSQSNIECGFRDPVQEQFSGIDPITLPDHAESAAGMKVKRIIVPFGAMLSSSFKMIKKKAYPNLDLCLQADCPEQLDKAEIYKSVIIVEVGQFVVWEDPVDNYNLYGKLNIQHMKSDQSYQEFYGDMGIGWPKKSSDSTEVGRLIQMSVDFTLDLIIHTFSELEM